MYKYYLTLIFINLIYKIYKYDFYQFISMINTNNRIEHKCLVCSNIEEHILTAENYLELASKYYNDVCENCIMLYNYTTENTYPCDQVYRKYFMRVTFIEKANGIYISTKVHNFPLLKLFKKTDMSYDGYVDIEHCQMKLRYYLLPKTLRGLNCNIEIVSAKICKYRTLPKKTIKETKLVPDLHKLMMSYLEKPQHKYSTMLDMITLVYKDVINIVN